MKKDDEWLDGVGSREEISDNPDYLKNGKSPISFHFILAKQCRFQPNDMDFLADINVLRYCVTLVDSLLCISSTPLGCEKIYIDHRVLVERVGVRSDHTLDAQSAGAGRLFSFNLLLNLFLG